MATWTPDQYAAACGFAAEAHRGQCVPGTDLPYLLHCAKVCAEVIAALRAEPGHDEPLAVQAALLHDTIEDTGTPFERLRDAFGEPVARAVLALSKDKALPKPRQMADSLRRIALCPPEAAMVKLADRITNLEPPPRHWDSGRIKAYQAQALTILDRLGPACPTLQQRLAQRIGQYGRFIA